jgi:gamma-glutamyltranspeptidase/glutathione hydrolase
MEKGGVRIGFRHHGWLEPGPCAIRVERGGFRHEYSGALDEPRFTKLSFSGCDVEIESRIPASVRKQLALMGHDVKVAKPFASPMGRGQAVLRDTHGVNYGASDPRGDGSAVPENPPVFKPR